MDKLKNEEEIAKLIEQRPVIKFEQEYWSSVSNECKTFICSCMDSNVGARFTANQAVYSSWFKRKAPSSWR